jgi:hypothetical protein
MSNLTTEQIINWLATNLSSLGMAELLEAIEEAGDRAAEMVESNPTIRTTTDELIFDEFWYGLRDSAAVLQNIETWSRIVTADESGITEWFAIRQGHSHQSQVYQGETEIQAIIDLLRAEEKEREARSE